MSKHEKPVILVTNDDGITAPGIRALVEVMQTIGEVIVVAPDSPQSATGHSITISKPLRLDKVSIHGESLGYQCSGTPVDCVKIAINKILHRKPDLCVSGINHGSNASINVIYSGTMSAAMEGAIEGIPSIGFSLQDFRMEADFEPAKKYVKEIALNVNIPNLPASKIKGIKICRQAMAKWREEFDERLDPNGRKYYWLTGKFINNDLGEDTDEWALANGFVSIVPTQFDLTAHHAIAYLNGWKYKL